MASSIGWILVVSGTVTAVGGLAAALFPKQLLELGFGARAVDAWHLFFVRHWGVLIFAVGALLAYSASAPAARAPILIAGAGEKIAVVLLILFGPLKRTVVMTAAAAFDGLFALLYIAYLAGL